MRRSLGLLVIALALVFGAGAVWFDSLFEEPDARIIESLAVELDAKVLLSVFAHPDDENMVVGALADATSRGVRVHVITATRGEQGVADVPVSGPEDLARIREAELREHARVIGVEEQLIWRFPDSAVVEHLEELTDRLVEEIVRIDPDAVLTFHPPSGYTNHLDHRTVGRATVRALERLGSDARLVYVAAPRRVMSLVGGDRGKAVVAKQPVATWALPIDPGVKLRGWGIHASQGQYMLRVWKLPPRVLFFFFDEEHFVIPERG